MHSHVVAYGKERGQGGNEVDNAEKTIASSGSSIRSLDVQEVIRLVRVTFAYVGEKAPIIRDCSFSLKNGDIHMIVGRNGSGKSTLAKLLAGLLQDHEGERTGEVLRKDSLIAGYISADAVSQFVIGTVEDELAFGPENLGVNPQEINQRIEEQLAFFGMDAYRERHVDTLSGGEQQRVAAMSIWTMAPHLLIVDDAWSQLDVEGRRSFYAKLLQWTESSGGALVLFTSRSIDTEEGEEASKLVRKAQTWHMENGKLTWLPEEVRACDASGLTKEHGSRPLAEDDIGDVSVGAVGSSNVIDPMAEKNAVLYLDQVRARYRGAGQDALKQAEAALRSGECALLHGRNGAGKSTLFRLITGAMMPVEGRIYLCGEALRSMRGEKLAQTIGYAPQRAAASFLADSVWNEALMVCKAIQALPKERHPASMLACPAAESWAQAELRELGLLELANHHPQELSLAEQRKLALWIASAHEPALLLLDEPTSGLDLEAAEHVVRWCEAQRRRGAAILVITHDPLWEQVRSRHSYQSWKLENGVLQICSNECNEKGEMA